MAQSEYLYVDTTFQVVIKGSLNEVVDFFKKATFNG